ncbi:hypothetical protein QYE76_048599 [Lolium multiflorum]|uniref:Uncharacterized protein n=1 Tax=Lolium multiflorum TaxID=4521 RepID=A0AAD8SM71_LOLMU|nr:hypothetical protein QYE76_048599 [Lolium multiflorum]
MSVGSDEPMTSELTSYYCSNCDAKHGLGSSDTPFICNARYSSGEDSVGSIVRRTTRRTAHHQVYVANNTGNTRHGGDGDRTPRSSRRASFENSASNRDSDYTIADEEWAAARTAVLNNTPLPAGTSVGTLNAYRSILEKNREHLSREQATLERRLSAAERSSERRRASQGSAPRSSLGAGKHRSRISRLSEDDAREITSNLTKSFMTTDTAGMPRPKNVAGATANLAAYLINQRPEGSMAQAHRGALESLAILGNNLVPQKEKTTAQASGSKHRARDARDEITQSRIDKARRRRAARKDDDSDSSDEDQEAIDAFSDGVRRESYIEELGRKKPKTITKLMEIANSWADGEDNVRRPRQRSDDEDDDQPKHDSGSRRDRNKRRKNRNYDDNNLVAAGYSDRHDDRYDERRDDRQDGNRNNSGNRGNYKPRQQRAPELPYAEQINAPCYLHSQDSNRYHLHLHLRHSTKYSRPNLINPAAFLPPRGQMSMIHKTGVSRREMKKLTREINLAESIMANIPEYVEWSSQNITFSRADHPMTIPKPGHAALVVEAQIGGFKMSKVFMDGGSGSDNFRKEKIEFEVVNWESQYHAILGRPAYAKFMAVPHYAYLKLKMPGNKGTNITVHGSFSRSDSCDRDFQRIAAKFGSKQEFIKPPPKLLLREIKEEKDDRGSKKKPADLALKASTAEASAAGALATKASAVKGSAVDDAKT